VNENAALDVFCDMVMAAETVVAHNIEFDVKIINNAARLLSGNPKIDVFGDKNQFCTMLAAVPVCKFPSKNGHKGFAWPKLEKAIPHLLQPPADRRPPSDRRRDRLPGPVLLPPGPHRSAGSGLMTTLAAAVILLAAIFTHRPPDQGAPA
jgi:hypothetical protein